MYSQKDGPVRMDQKCMTGYEFNTYTRHKCVAIPLYSMRRRCDTSRQWLSPVRRTYKYGAAALQSLRRIELQRMTPLICAKCVCWHRANSPVMSRDRA